MFKSKRKGAAPAAPSKPKVLTCMGYVDEDSPLLRAGPRRTDGAASYNGYFWPLPDDDFWANASLGNRYSGRFHFCVIALEDGTWLSEGKAYHAKTYATRQAALRAAAARLIRMARNSRQWKGFDQLTPEQFEALIGWIYGVLDRPPPPIRVPDSPAPATAAPAAPAPSSRPAGKPAPAPTLFDWQDRP